MSLVGRKVHVTFNTKHWPIESATYTYEGHDDKGHWVRKADGTQRYILNVDLSDISPVDEEPPQ